MGAHVNLLVLSCWDSILFTDGPTFKQFCKCSGMLDFYVLVMHELQDMFL